MTGSKSAVCLEAFQLISASMTRATGCNTGVRFEARCSIEGCVACAVQREANKLVEEFMLLANMSTAALIADAFPERALLRRHPPPNQRKLEEVSNLSNSLVGFRQLSCVSCM